MESAKPRRGPREAASYRAARRNAVLRPVEGPKGVWPRVEARYEPYQPSGDRRAVRRVKRLEVKALRKIAALGFLPFPIFRRGLR